MNKLKLHLGCGNLKLDGWVNVDWNKNECTDLVEDISILPSFKENSVDVIYACHVLEHFGLDENIEQPRCADVLSRWYSILKPSGEIYISVPNLLNILKGIELHQKNLRAVYDYIRCCFGGQNYRGNTHYSGFTPEFLRYMLQRANFSDISEFEPFVKTDTSTFGIYNVPVSLNLKGYKYA